ncbi:hypothetical protein JHL18_07570 [Clostridium sp. YIM B02505]|uniref:Uncharacterized protein n=1 Tax=Clostridium yunnanense TaxID=2800325 RepID=A0ABS1EMB8_9CLOT|nr:hypothetical protein [Clostridium yunnanense]MBK1810491.1 hypothetical protein [Clostridium yunnanense]
MVMKKKGSTLVTVVAVFAILFTVGTAILSLSLSSYKLRKVESKKIENLYGSESGIDAAKKIIQVAVNTAIKKANSDVIKANNNINNQIEDLKAHPPNNSNYYDYINDAVRDQQNTNNINYLLWKKDENGDNTPANTLHYVNEDGTINLADINTKLKAVFDKSYFEFLNVNLSYCVITNPDGTRNYNYLLLDGTNSVVRSNFELNSTAVVSLNYTPLTATEISAQINGTTAVLPVTLASVFTSTDGVRREIEARYNISAPDLTNHNVVNNPLLQKSIVADGNMYVKGNLTVNGDVFVKGEEQRNNDNGIVYTKYDGGININIDPTEITGSTEMTTLNRVEVNFNGNVVTPSTFNVKQNSNVNVNGGNLYANNVNLGKIKRTDSYISNNTLNVNTDMVVYNDFTFNADNTTVGINNLYAVNDLTDDSVDVSRKSKSSSSIIVNRALGTSSITINNDAYILGSAYIRVGENNENYQTGESIAVKGNYLAYTSPITNTPDDYQFQYLAPLQLVSRRNGADMLMAHKKDYFLLTANRTEIQQNQGSIHLQGGVDKLYISGAYISDGQARAPVPESVDKTAKLINKRKEYANQAYEMGSFNNSDIIGTDQANDPLLQKYNAMIVDKTVSNLTNFPDNAEHSDDVNGIIEEEYIHSGVTRPILLGDPTSINSLNQYSKVININNKRGIIITNCDVVFDNKNLNFTGTIITTKNISFLQGSHVQIDYDGKLVQKLISTYNLQALFNSGKTINSQITGITGITRAGEATENIDYSSCIRSDYWRINR